MEIPKQEKQIRAWADYFQVELNKWSRVKTLTLSKKSSPIWGGLPILGGLAIVVGLLIRSEVWDNSEFAYLDNPWGDVVILGGILLLVGIAVLLGTCDSSSSTIWKFRFVWLMIALLGIVTVALGILTKTEVLTGETSEYFEKAKWLEFLLVGSILMGTGLAVFLGTLDESPNMKALLWKVSPIFLLVMLAGLALVLVGAAVEADYVSSTDVEGYEWDELYIIGLILFIPALASFLVSLSDSFREISWKLWPVWIFVALIGMVFAVMGTLAAFRVFDQTAMTFNDEYAWIELLLYSIPLLVIGLGFLLTCAPTDTRYRISRYNVVWGNLIGLGGLVVVLDLLRRYEFIDNDLLDFQEFQN